VTGEGMARDGGRVWGRGAKMNLRPALHLTLSLSLSLSLASSLWFLELKGRRQARRGIEREAAGMWQVGVGVVVVVFLEAIRGRRRSAVSPSISAYLPVSASVCICPWGVRQGARGGFWEGAQAKGGEGTRFAEQHLMIGGWRRAYRFVVLDFRPREEPHLS
jgi:hypothetical protein